MVQFRSLHADREHLSKNIHLLKKWLPMTITKSLIHALLHCVNSAMGLSA